MSLGALATSDAAPEAAPRRPEIWFTPVTWDIKPGGGLEYTGHDFPALVKSDAGWKMAGPRIGVFAVPANVVWSYPDLPELVSFVARHSWKFGLSFGVEFSGGRCGQGVEGISQDQDVNREAVAVAQRWREAGGRLDYILMDSPMFFPVYVAKDCHFSIEDAAQRAAATLRGILAEYPNAKIVDAEGPGRIQDGTWLADMTRWFAAFKRSSGRSIDAVELDLHWTDLRPGNDWQQTARRSVAAFRQQGIGVGLLVNADDKPGLSDQQWMAENRDHIQELASGQLGLDFIHICQWMGHVRANLPETDPEAYSSLVNFAHDSMAAHLR